MKTEAAPDQDVPSRSRQGKTLEGQFPCYPKAVGSITVDVTHHCGNSRIRGVYAEVGCKEVGRETPYQNDKTHTEVISICFMHETLF